MSFVKTSILSLAGTAMAVAAIGCNGGYSGQSAGSYPFGQPKQPTEIDYPCSGSHQCVHELYGSEDLSVGVGFGTTRIPGRDGGQAATVSLVIRR